MMLETKIVDKKLILGWDEDKNRIEFDVRLSRVELEDEERQTINHSRIKKYTALGISCGAWNSRRQDYDYCGQMVGSIRVKKYKNKNITQAKIDRIVAIWKEYHLNDLQAGCRHQQEQKTCPKKYRYGSRWLIKLIPNRIEKEIIELFA